MVQKIERENERRVINVSDLESGVREQLVVVRREFWAQVPDDHRIDSMRQYSETFLFDRLEDSQGFGALLDKNGIAYSCHPAKDYQRVGTQDMDAFGRAVV